MNRIIEKNLQKQRREADRKYRILFENHLKKLENDKQILEHKLLSEKEDLIARKDEDFKKLHDKYKVFRDKQDQNHKQELIIKQRELKNFNPCSNYELQ